MYGKGGTNNLFRQFFYKTWSLVLECSFKAHSRKIFSDGHYFWLLASIPTWLSFITGGSELATWLVNRRVGSKAGCLAKPTYVDLIAFDLICHLNYFLYC